MCSLSRDRALGAFRDSRVFVELLGTLTGMARVRLGMVPIRGRRLSERAMDALTQPIVPAHAPTKAILVCVMDWGYV